MSKRNGTRSFRSFLLTMALPIFASPVVLWAAILAFPEHAIGSAFPMEGVNPIFVTNMLWSVFSGFVWPIFCTVRLLKST